MVRARVRYYLVFMVLLFDVVWWGREWGTLRGRSSRVDGKNHRDREDAVGVEDSEDGTKPKA